MSACSTGCIDTGIYMKSQSPGGVVVASSNLAVPTKSRTYTLAVVVVANLRGLASGPFYLVVPRMFRRSLRLILAARPDDC